MIKNDLYVFHLRKSTIIQSDNNIFSFGRVESEWKKDVICFCTLKNPYGIFTKLEDTRIVKVDLASVRISTTKGWEYSTFSLIPRFGFDSQKLEDIICDIFRKHNL